MSEDEITDHWHVVPVVFEDVTFYFAFNVIRRDGKVVNMRPWVVPFRKESKAQRFCDVMNDVAEGEQDETATD